MLRIYGLPLLIGTLVLTALFGASFKGQAAVDTFDRIWRADSQAETCLANGDLSAYLSASHHRKVSEHDFTTWPAPTPPLSLDASLEERLSAWNSTPVSTASEWIKFNMQTCPNSRTYENKLWGFVSPQEDNNGAWDNLWRDPGSILTLRKEMFDYLLALRDKGLLDRAHQGVGRGIVLSAGNLDTFARALVTVRLLRDHLNSSIPVEIFHFPGETPEPDILEKLEALGAKVREAPDLAKDVTRLKNWHIKASAIIASSFQHVLYLDSDNMPVFAPDDPREGVFFGKGYQRLGVMFWPDYWKSVGQSPVWQIIGVQCRDEWEQEAGAVLVDKSRHLDALHLADYMLRHYDLWFHLSDGDKDLFRYAFLALRKRWAVPGRLVGGASWSKGPVDAYCGHTMLQHDHRGRPAFAHANMLKKIDVWEFEEKGPTGQIWGVTATTPAAHTDGDTDCDQLANPNLYGEAISYAPANVRARAALERGVRVWFYGVGPWPSCLNIRWDDPRTDDERIISQFMGHMRQAETQPTYFIGADDDWQSPLYTAQWSEDDRLRNFEKAFWAAGGVPTGRGFG